MLSVELSEYSFQTPLYVYFYNTFKVFKVFNKFKVFIIYSGKDAKRLYILTTAQLHSTKPELTFCAGSDLASGVLEIRDSEDL